MIKDIAKLKAGDKVHYQPSHYDTDTWENGIIKEVPKFTMTAVRVVYNCNSEWNRYKEYTSALTNLRDLHIGWKFKEE